MRNISNTEIVIQIVMKKAHKFLLHICFQEAVFKSQLEKV
jgi:hypothetical protein